MKNKKTFIIDIIVGILFVGIGLFVFKTGYYSTLFLAMGFGLCFASCVQLFKLYYYEMPKNKEKYENKKKEDYINSIDERKIFLRMKAGSSVYQIMTFVLLIISFILALLRVDTWIIIMIFGLFLLQTALGIIIYNRFQKRL